MTFTAEFLRLAIVYFNCNLPAVNVFLSKLEQLPQFGVVVVCLYETCLVAGNRESQYYFHCLNLSSLEFLQT